MAIFIYLCDSTNIINSMLLYYNKYYNAYLYCEVYMGSIRININSRAMPKQTSTTFTETLARFFLYAWCVKSNHKKTHAESWLVMDVKSKKHQSRKNVAKNFQGAINEMISQYDAIHGCDDSSSGRWTRDKIEYQLLTVIAGLDTLNTTK